MWLLAGFIAGCGLRASVPWQLLVADHSLPSEPLHREAHSVAAGLLRLNKLRKVRNSKVEVTVF